MSTRGTSSRSSTWCAARARMKTWPCCWSRIRPKWPSSFRASIGWNTSTKRWPWHELVENSLAKHSAAGAGLEPDRHFDGAGRDAGGGRAGHPRRGQPVVLEQLRPGLQHRRRRQGRSARPGAQLGLLPGAAGREHSLHLLPRVHRGQVQGIRRQGGAAVPGRHVPRLSRHRHHAGIFQRSGLRRQEI